MSWSPPPLETFAFTISQRRYLLEQLEELQRAKNAADTVAPIEPQPSDAALLDDQRTTEGDIPDERDERTP